MDIHEILESRDLFAESDEVNYTENKSLFFSDLSKHKNTVDTIIDVINKNKISDFLTEMFSYQCATKLDISGDFYIHLLAIPLTQYNVAPINKENKLCLKNCILRDASREIRNVLTRSDISYKPVHILFPMDIIISHGLKIIDPITQAIRNDIEHVQNSDDDDVNDNRMAYEVLDEIGAENAPLYFDSDIINNSVALIYSLSSDITPPKISDQDLLKLEDIISYQYGSLVDGYRCIAHQPVSPEMLPFIKVGSSISAYVDKYDIDSPTVTFEEIHTSSDSVNTKCSITSPFSTSSFVIEFTIQNNLHLPHHLISSEIIRVVNKINPSILFE